MPYLEETLFWAFFYILSAISKLGPPDRIILKASPVVGFVGFLTILILYVCACFACVYTTRVPGVHGGQKKRSESLELELWVSVSPHVAAGYRTWVLWKSSKYSYCCAVSPGLRN